MPETNERRFISYAVKTSHHNKFASIYKLRCKDFSPRRKPAFCEAGSICSWWSLRTLLIRWIREPFPVALFNAAHGSKQMVIRACS